MKNIAPEDYRYITGAFSWAEFGVTTGGAALTGAAIGAVVGAVIGTPGDKVGSLVRWSLMVGGSFAVLGAALDASAQAGCASCSQKCQCQSQSQSPYGWK